MTATATSQNIIPFAFEDNLVRVYKPNGEPWFVGRDVCKVLDIKNESHALGRLDEDERRDGVVISDPMGREQTVICVNEPGIFRLIFTSRKPEAERFKRWLAHDVLPTLRKSGTFALPGQITGKPGDAPPSEDGPVGVLNAKLGLIREARLLFGPDRARGLWASLGLPDVPDPDAARLVEARACLDHLLKQPLGENDDKNTPFTLRHAIASEIEDGGYFDMPLREAGIRVLHSEDGFVLAHAFTFEKRFTGTRWTGQKWRAQLVKLPGAFRHGPTKFAGSNAHRGVFLPAAVLDEE